MGTCNFRDYNSWLEGKVAILVWEPYRYTDEDNEEYLRDYCEANDKKYEYPCRHCKAEILEDRERLDYDDEIDNVKYTTKQVFKEVFGDEDAFTFTPESGYYEGLQWFYDDEELSSAINDKLYNILETLEELEPLREKGIYLEGELSEDVGSLENLHSVIRWHSDEDEEGIIQKTLTDEFGKKLLALSEECKKEICEKADKAVRKIAKELGLKVAYYCCSYCGPSYVEP